jgi:uncharacterized protein (TIGR02444 family)
MKSNNGIAGENPFWDFSLKFYEYNSVASSCIALQDSVNADVNILLYCCWVASEGAVVIKPAEFNEIIEAIDPWQSFVVRGLRKIRLDMKKEKLIYFGKMSDDLRACIKQCEIEGERIEQMILYQSGQKLFVKKSIQTSERIGNARANLRNYIETISGSINETTDNLIQTISNDLMATINR